MAGKYIVWLWVTEGKETEKPKMSTLSKTMQFSIQIARES